MTDSKDNETPRADWQRELSPRFLTICSELEIATPEQAWVLALALRDSPKAFEIDEFDPEELNGLIRRLTPAERSFDQVAFQGPMPISGALKPANLPGKASGVPTAGVKTLADLEADAQAETPAQPRGKDEEGNDADT